jgi:hypothetical protein
VGRREDRGSRVIALPWSETEAAYVAAVLHEQAQGKVEMASLIRPGSLVKELRADLADQAIRIEGLVTDLLQAEVTTTEREDDLGAAGTQTGDPAG